MSNIKIEESILNVSINFSSPSVKSHSRSASPTSPKPLSDSLQTDEPISKEMFQTTNASIDKMTCRQCGKNYKSTVSLSKHLWEHSEYWNAELKTSKHEQVQILEAAAVLVALPAGEC
jgi:hypothetical protein